MHSKKILLLVVLTVLFKSSFSQQVMGPNGIELLDGYYLIDKKGQFINYGNGDRFTNMGEFRDGLALVRTYKGVTSIWKGYSFINTKGERVSDYYDGVECNFSNNRAVVRTAKGKFILIDNACKELMTLKYSWFGKEFSEGLLLVKKEGYVCGFIDTTGNEVIKANLIYATSFQNGMAFVVPEKGKGKFIDRNQKTILEAPYGDCAPFKEGFSHVRVEVDGKVKHGLINRQGKLVVPLLESIYNGPDFEPRIHKGLGSYFVKGSSVRILVDTLGNEVPQPENYYDGFSNTEKKKDFSKEKMYPLAATIGKYEYYGYVDSVGTVVVPPVFREVYPFKHGVGIVYYADMQHQDELSAKYKEKIAADYPGYNAATSCSSCFGRGFVEMEGSCGSCSGKGFNRKWTYNAFDKTVDVKQHTDGSQTIYYVPGGSSSYSSGGCETCKGTGKPVMTCGTCAGKGTK